MLLKYDPNLVFLSSAARAYATGYFPAGIALDTTTGNSYVTGIDQGADGENESLSNIRTVRFAPLGGAVPVVYVSTADVSPAFYLAGQQAAALKITPYTLSGSVAFTGLQVAINPVGAYTNIASVALYDDSNNDGMWNPQNDTLLSSGAVTSSSFNFTQADGIIDTLQVALFIALTPAVTAVSSNVNVAVLSSNSFTIGGDMAQRPSIP